MEKRPETLPLMTFLIYAKTKLHLIGHTWALSEYNYATYNSSNKLWSPANVWHDRKIWGSFLEGSFLLQCKCLCRWLLALFFFATVCNTLDVLIYSLMFYLFDLLNLLNIWYWPVYSLVSPSVKSHKILFFLYHGEVSSKFSNYEFIFPGIICVIDWKKNKIFIYNGSFHVPYFCGNLSWLKPSWQIMFHTAIHLLTPPSLVE